MSRFFEVVRRFYVNSRWFQVGVHVLAAWVVLEVVHALAGARGGGAEPIHFAASDTKVETPAAVPVPAVAAPGARGVLPAAALDGGLKAEVLDLRTNQRVCIFRLTGLTSYSWKTTPAPTMCRLPRGARFRLRVTGLVRVPVDGRTLVTLSNTAGAARVALGGVPIFDFAEASPGSGPVLTRRREASLDAGWVRLVADYDGLEGVPGAIGLDIGGRLHSPVDFAHEPSDFAHDER